MSQTLTVTSPAIPDSLEPVRLWGREGINSLFAYELLLKTPDALNFSFGAAAGIDLDSFIGREISCMIELDGAGEFIAGAVGGDAGGAGADVREINALITDAQFCGEEGRHVQYKLTLRPWLHLATLSTDCKIYQNKTVVQILDDLLADYAFPVDKQLSETGPVRDFQVQFNESDFAFFERLCQEFGISYYFAHGEGRQPLQGGLVPAADPRARPGHCSLRLGWRSDGLGERSGATTDGALRVRAEQLRAGVAGQCAGANH